jgi:hypothetical protein
MVGASLHSSPSCSAMAKHRESYGPYLLPNEQNTPINRDTMHDRLE